MQTICDQHEHKPGFVQPMQALEQLFCEDQLVLFQKRTVVFMQESFPALSGTLTEADIEALSLAVMKQAQRWHYVTEREIWQYLIVVVFCGFFFDIDPQYAGLLHAVDWNTQDAGRSQTINRLLDLVDGFYMACEKDFTTFDSKFRYIAQFYMSRDCDRPLTDDQRIDMMHKLLQSVFPVRLALLTPQACRHVLAVNLRHADSLGFSVRDGFIYTLAAIYFGQAFERSPVYPWAHFLGDINIPAVSRVRQFIEAARNHFGRLMSV